MGGEISELSAAEAAALLGWWLESGVDVAVQEEPRDWLRKDASQPQPADPVETAASAPLDTPTAPEEAPDTLELFRQWLGTSKSVPLAHAGGRRVLPAGAENAPLMLLADAPTGEESEAGQPIAGAAWELTQRMLAAIGLDLDHVYLANISCFHAPGLRMSAAEREHCATIARRHVALARPKRLLLLGDTPCEALLGRRVASARGHVHSVEGVHTIATFDPRFLLNRPSSKALAWSDLLLLMEEPR